MHDPQSLRSLHLARFQAEPAVFAAAGRGDVTWFPRAHLSLNDGGEMPAPTIPGPAAPGN